MHMKADCNRCHQCQGKCHLRDHDRPRTLYSVAAIAHAVVDLKPVLTPPWRGLEVWWLELNVHSHTENIINDDVRGINGFAIIKVLYHCHHNCLDGVAIRLSLCLHAIHIVIVVKVFLLFRGPVTLGIPCSNSKTKTKTNGTTLLRN